MARAKRGFKRRRRANKMRDLAEGFVMGRGSQYRRMAESVDRAHVYAYRDRRVKKRDFRALWISRISAAASLNDMSYSRLLSALNQAKVKLNRKMLSDIAIQDPSGFTAVVNQVRTLAPAH